MDIKDNKFIEFNHGGIIMKIPKKFVAGIIGAAGTAAPLVSDIVNEKIKEKREQEKIYANQKHNGMVKKASIVFSLIGLFLSILAIKQSNAILAIVGFLAVTAYVITFLYCLEIINEKKHNTYKITFIIGDMLMVIAATFLFF